MKETTLVASIPVEPKGEIEFERATIRNQGNSVVYIAVQGNAPEQKENNG